METNKFEKALKSVMSNAVSVTENGACGFATSSSKLLDINFAVSSLRNKTAEEIEKMFSDAFYESPITAVKWLFFCRDVRQGIGERRTFRICFNWLATVRKDLVLRLFPLIMEYGRCDDLFCVFDEFVGIDDEIKSAVINLIDNQITTDLENMKAGKPVSLLAKWMPSLNTSSPKTVKLARFLAKKLDLSEKQYRKTLSSLRAYLNVIEQKMSAKKWGEIDYNVVPSKANVKYKNAFLRNDPERRKEYLAKLEAGDKSVKINSAVNFPCDIVHSYTDQFGWSNQVRPYDAALEAMWKALPNYVKDFDSGSTIVTADGSGSMMAPIRNSSVTALEVANSLAIYFAEKLTGPFKDKYITFSTQPQYVDFSNANSLREKLDIAFKYGECSNTNIEAVFDLILKTAVDNRLSQADIPANVLICSDMEFDSCAESNTGYISSRYNADKCALFEVLKKRWEDAGFKMPRLVFWNICGRTGTIPMQHNSNGVALVSGFSPATAKMVFSAKLDPYEVLLDTLNSERYQPVEDAVKEII